MEKRNAGDGFKKCSDILVASLDKIETISFPIKCIWHISYTCAFGVERQSVVKSYLVQPIRLILLASIVLYIFTFVCFNLVISVFVRKIVIVWCENEHHCEK